MLTYAELKEAESLALYASRRNGCAPMAITTNPKPAWWEFSPKPFKVVLHTHDIPDAQVIVGGICAKRSDPVD